MFKTRFVILSLILMNCAALPRRPTPAQERKAVETVWLMTAGTPLRVWPRVHVHWSDACVSRRSHPGECIEGYSIATLDRCDVFAYWHGAFWDGAFAHEVLHCLQGAIEVSDPDHVREEWGPIVYNAEWALWQADL